MHKSKSSKPISAAEAFAMLEGERDRYILYQLGVAMGLLFLATAYRTAFLD
jgi:hypothetical protein